jgi:hypothetical protein
MSGKVHTVVYEMRVRVFTFAQEAYFLQCSMYAALSVTRKHVMHKTIITSSHCYKHLKTCVMSHVLFIICTYC